MADDDDGVAAKFSREKGHGWLIVELCFEGEEEEGKGLLSWLFGRGGWRSWGQCELMGWPRVSAATTAVVSTLKELRH